MKLDLCGGASAAPGAANGVLTAAGMKHIAAGFPKLKQLELNGFCSLADVADVAARVQVVVVNNSVVGR